MIELKSKNELMKILYTLEKNNDLKNVNIKLSNNNNKIIDIKEVNYNLNEVKNYKNIMIYSCSDIYTNSIELLEKGKYYKDYEEIFLGYSDIASLVIVTCDHKRGLESNILKMGSDGQYFAYLCNNAEIGEHYIKKYDCDGWIKIYDDNKKMFDQFGKFEIYRAGDFGIIINKL